uniref:ANK_REP_REGION domain-containing protein n=1 Tax=Macrostomum lignano TaxID=282301 RepID=A0A1I8J214_9PLAT
PTEDELISALASNNSGAVQSIISGGKCVDHFIVYKGKHFTPAMIACDLERTDLLIILIEAKVDLDRQNSDGISAFTVIIKWLSLLIKAQADIDLAYCSPLYMAAQEGHCKVIESLVRAQAEVNLQTVIGSTPLYVASLEDRYQAVELLIKAQADVDLQDFDGFSPLYIASEQGYLKVVNSLIGGKADVNLQDSKGCSPIFAACQQGHYQVVESLLKAQADVTSANGAGKTPLDIASQNNHYQTVKLIIEFCIRNGIQGSYLKQGLRCAEEFENDRVVELFHAATSLDDSGINVEKYHTDEYFVVGSFAEGWGNSLVTLDGRTDFDSDVDVMWLTHGKPFHLKDFCECADRTSNPARSYLGFNQRPTLDEVPAHRLCRYPPIAPLQPDRVAKSNIFPAVLQSIQRDVTSASSPCHIVHAAPPGKAGEQL